MKNYLIYLVFLTTFLQFGCSNDDDSLESDSFFDGALTNITNSQLEGSWAIFQIKYNNQISDVPVTYAACGRNFFRFQSEGIFREYIFNGYECKPEIGMYSWSLSNGVVSLTSGNLIDKWVVILLTNDSLTFKVKVDVDSDGKKDIVEIICHRYTPPNEIDIYSNTFHWPMLDENMDKILLKWDSYAGYNEFVKYEIYRMGENCDTSNPELVATIQDKNQNTFIDLTPPPYTNICYKLKVYTNLGLLGESDLENVDTWYIKVPAVNLNNPVLNGTNVQLSWEQYQGYYFSHYEIEVRNYSDGSGGGYQEEQIGTVNTKTITNFNSELPYFNNPVYVLHVYNIFGKKSDLYYNAINQKVTNFINNAILPVNTIRFLDFSPNETILYFTDYNNLYKYNYNTKTIENSVQVNSSSVYFLKVFQSNYGTEVIINVGSQLKVYDTNLNFKYNLITNGYYSPDNMIFTETGHWLFADREKLYSFSRNGSNLNLINSNNLYNHSFCCSLINIKDIGQNRILIGNIDELQGLIVNIGNNGILNSTTTSVTMNMTSAFKYNAFYSANQHYVLDTESRKIYSTINYNLNTILNQNFYPSGIGNNGALILGTNNVPNDDPSNFHEKKVRTLSYPSLQEQVYNSKGYPMVVYQNHLGQIISISKGLKGSLSNYSIQNDIFIEVIN